MKERRVVNMLLRRLLPLYNETMERLISASKFSKSKEAKFRLSVVEFSKKYGVKAVQDAYGVGRTNNI
jgi:hypothetical protein